MYAFEDLCSREDYPFAYLIGVLREVPREDYLVADFFTGGFDFLLTMEDQAESPESTISSVDLYKDWVTPTAPLTMTPSWSPFPFAFRALPQPIAHGRNEERDASAFGIWEPELFSTGESQLKVGDEVVETFANYVSEEDIDFGGDINFHHFFWLLQMTVERAKKMDGKVLVAGCPGWSYKNELKYGTPAHMRLRLIEAGYLYPERIPHVARTRQQGADDQSATAVTQKAE